jgi:hypothetical protein
MTYLKALLAGTGSAFLAMAVFSVVFIWNVNRTHGGGVFVTVGAILMNPLFWLFILAAFAGGCYISTK